MDSLSSNVRGLVPMYLNVYDLTPMNGYMYRFGIGIFHSGIEAHGVEYGYGAHDYPTSGVFEVEPRSCPGFTFRRSIMLGTTELNPSQFREFIEHLASDYNGDSYHLIAKNCNHFTNDVCLRLTGSGIPGWVNRLAQLGWLCNCVLPESLQVTTVPRAPEYDTLQENGVEAWSNSNLMEIEDKQDNWLLMEGTGSVQLSIRDRSNDVIFKHMESS
ncbi:hypothetical protein O6H91_14G071700 [Diphasiastrum complanatum]|uniref:Uncharacterized protein n=1 Tax=Diphasiastrum complanatum TaxID=34168 RepID=A0ACC2BQR9_DIPCM|nr:hypothetical protein O6H91_14G071700 [Diphasiastrum complanatum]